MYLSDQQIIALARTAPVVPGWRFLFEFVQFIFRRDHNMETKWFRAPLVYITASSTSQKDPTPIVKPKPAFRVGKKGETGPCREMLVHTKDILYIEDKGKHRLVLDGECAGIVSVVCVTFNHDDEGDILQLHFIQDFLRLSAALGAKDHS
jgi:hypothetical protein